MTRALDFFRRYLRAAAGAVWLFTVGWAQPHNRPVLDVLGNEVGLVARPVPEAPGIGVWELVTENVSIQLREPVAVNGNTSLQELAVLAALVAQRRPLRIFEIGTFDGRSTVNMAVNTTPDAEVFTLDLPAGMASSTALTTDPHDIQFVEKPTSGARFAGADVSSRITQLRGDSATFDFGPYRGTVDLVFIDGSHSYEYVLSDSRNALDMLRAGGGVVLWHDYGVWPGVTRALNELHRRDHRFAGLRHVVDTSFGYLAAD